MSAFHPFLPLPEWKLSTQGRWGGWLPLPASSLHRPMDSVPGGQHGGVAHLFVPDCNRSPEAIERPTLIGKVGKEGEREAKRKLPFDGRRPGLLCNFVDRSKRPFPQF